jgi:hypothetical protein
MQKLVRIVRIVRRLVFQRVTADDLIVGIVRQIVRPIVADDPLANGGRSRIWDRPL